MRKVLIYDMINSANMIKFRKATNRIEKVHCS